MFLWDKTKLKKSIWDVQKWISNLYRHAGKMIVCVAAEDSGCGWQNFRKHCLHLLTHHHLLSNHWRVCRKLLVFSQRSTLTPSFLCPLFPSFKFLLLQLDPIQTVPVVCRNLCNQPCLFGFSRQHAAVCWCVCLCVGVLQGWHAHTVWCVW